VALDCEFVGVGADGAEHALARVSLVNFHGAVLLDQYVKPGESVTDYRTSVSGVRPGHVHGKQAIPFKQVQRQVAELIKDRILVGHALHNDLQVLLLPHPKHLIRDTSKYKGLCPDRPRSLKNLVAEVLGHRIQIGEHNSVEDARAALALYKKCRVEWEQLLFDAQHQRKHRAPGQAAEAAAATPAAVAAAASSHVAARAAIAASSAAASSAATSVRPALSSAKAAAALQASIESRRAARSERNAERNQRRTKRRVEQKRAEREG
jgi:RNA exonuclease 4